MSCASVNYLHFYRPSNVERKLFFLFSPTGREHGMDVTPTMQSFVLAPSHLPLPGTICNTARNSFEQRLFTICEKSVGMKPRCKDFTATRALQSRVFICRLNITLKVTSAYVDMFAPPPCCGGEAHSLDAFADSSSAPDCVTTSEGTKRR